MDATTLLESHLRSKMKLEMRQKAHIENDLLELLTDPAETRIDLLMSAQAMHAGLVKYEDPTEDDARKLLRDARKLLRSAYQ